MAHQSLAAQPDERLERRLRSLAWGEKQVLASFLRHLAEFDARKAYRPRGYSSLFRYCIGRLGLSEDEAYLRIQAARLSRDHPEVLRMVARGDIHLSGMARLSPHLTTTNAAAILEEARGKSKRDVERIAARFGIHSPRADMVRHLPPPAMERTHDRVEPALLFGQASSAQATPSPVRQDIHSDPDETRLPSTMNKTPSPLSTSPRINGARPPISQGLGAPSPSLTEDDSASSSLAEDDSASSSPTEVNSKPNHLRLVRIAFTASEDLAKKLEVAKAFLRHKHPAGRLENVIEEAVDLLLDKLDLERRPTDGRTPRASRPGTRVIAQSVKVKVWKRDGGRCAFVSTDGIQCKSTDWLEFDHVVPWALGGSSGESNIRLLCRSHNQFSAELALGPRLFPWMQKGRRKSSDRPVKN